MILKNVKEFTKNWKSELKDAFAALDEAPVLVIFQVGADRYVKNKVKDCEEVGIVAQVYKFDEAISEENLIKELRSVQKNTKNLHGIIVQLPLPDHINRFRVLSQIYPWFDVDNLRGLRYYFNSCTATGIMRYLDYCGWEPSGKNVVIIGRSELVGKQLAQLMTEDDATVTLCHSRTKNLDHYLHEADLIVCAVGKPNFLNCYSIHVPVIDVGTNFDKNGKLVGDCFNTENREVTPVPGGVDLLTRCMLMDNMYQSATIHV